MFKTALKQTILQYCVSLCVLLVFALCVSTVSVLNAGWYTVGSSPAAGNATTTLHAGSGTQVKAGNLAVADYTVAGDLIVTASTTVASSSLPVSPLTFLADGGVAANEYCNTAGTECVSQLSAGVADLTLPDIEMYITTANPLGLTYNDPDFGPGRPVCSCAAGEHLLDCSGGVSNLDTAAFTGDPTTGTYAETNACWAEDDFQAPNCHCLRLQ